MVIWFNHWFSTAYYFIEQAKKAGHYVIATNERDTCVYKMNADEFYIEEVMDSERYISWAINFCKNHDVDIFFCKRHMIDISKQIDKFNGIGVKVIVESYENIKIFESKQSTFEFFKKHNICNVPEMFIVNDINSFLSRYKYLKEKYPTVCCKLNIDEGGQSFKKISTAPYSIDTLKFNQGFSIQENDLFKILEKESSFEDIVLMPYLNGTEYSIDCFNTKSGLVAVPRYKLNNRVTRLENNKNLIDIANKFQKESGLISAYNIQLRENDGELYLLEVNTRLAGGSWKDSFVGFNFVNLIIDNINGLATDLESIYNKFHKMDISNIENAIQLV